MHSKIQIGRAYEDVGARQQRRRRQQIKERVTNYLSSLKEMGLEPKKLHLETEKRTVQLKLDPFDDAEQSEEESVCDEAKIGATALIISKNHISMESYHELAMIYEDMARSCEVSMQLHTLLLNCTWFSNIFR